MFERVVVLLALRVPIVGLIAELEQFPGVSYNCSACILQVYVHWRVVVLLEVLQNVANIIVVEADAPDRDIRSNSIGLDGHVDSFWLSILLGLCFLLLYDDDEEAFLVKVSAFAVEVAVEELALLLVVVDLHEKVHSGMLDSED